jgi:hypothetical protein
VWPLLSIFSITNPEIFVQVNLGKTTSYLHNLNGDLFTDILYSTSGGDLKVFASKIK